MNRTYFNLLAEFGSGEIRLEDCCEKYFGMDAPHAKRKAMMQKLPVKVYRAPGSQKAGWLVDAMDLAKMLDEQKAEAGRVHALMNESSPLRDAG